MDEAPKITGIQNDSKKRIAEDSKSEDQPLQKRMKISSSNTDDSTKPIIKPLSLDRITKIPGLQHISEDIFKLLEKKCLMDCRLVNSSWKNVLDQPMFWLNKLKSAKMSLDVQKRAA